MINPATEQWRLIPGCCKYAMSDQGKVKSVKLQKLLDPRPSSHRNKTGVAYYVYDDEGVGRFKTAKYWMNLTWPEIEIDFTDQWRIRVRSLNDLPKRQPKTERKPRSSKRPCTDCGKPTTDYRCPRCWKKRRATATGAEPIEVYKTAYGGW